MYCIHEAKYEDMRSLSNIMVQSFRSAFASFVTEETMDACANENNCQAMLEAIYQEGKMHFLMGTIVWQLM